MNLTLLTAKQLDAMRSIKDLPSTYYQEGKPTKRKDSTIDRSAKPKVLAARLAVLPHEFDIRVTAKAWHLQKSKSSHSRINILRAEGLVEATGIKIDNHMIYRKTQLAYIFEKTHGVNDE